MTEKHSENSGYYNTAVDLAEVDISADAEVDTGADAGVDTGAYEEVDISADANVTGEVKEGKKQSEDLKQETEGGEPEPGGDDSPEKDKAKDVPDGGYGWIIVLGSALAHCIIGGLERSDGVLFLKFITRFNQSAQATAWVSSLCNSLRLVLGPLASIMCNRFGCRVTVIVGAIVTALGIFCSGFTTDLIQLYFTYGVVSGVGRCLAYAPAVIITGQYFNKRRGLALGLATAGIGVGTFAVPPAVEFIFEEYTYLGAFLIVSAFSLNFAVCGALFRPLSLHQKLAEVKRKRESQNLEGNKNTSTRKLGKDNRRYVENLPHDRNSNIFAVSFKKINNEITSENLKVTSEDNSKREKPTKSVRKNANVSGPKPQKKKFLELSLLKEAPFCIFCISIFLFTASFKAGFTFLPPLVKSSGISESNAAFVLSVTGVFDAVGRIFAGFVFDFPKVKRYRTLIYCGIVFVIAALSFVCPSLSTFVAFASLGAFYGLLTGSFVSQKSVIIVDLLGVQKLSSSFGLLICFQGFGTLVGPPISGLMKDIYGRYDEAFYFCGGSMLFAGLIMLTANIWQRMRASAKTNNGSSK